MLRFHLHHLAPFDAGVSPPPLDAATHTHTPAAALFDDEVSPTPAAVTRICPVVAAKEDLLSESVKESSLLLYQLSSAPRMSFVEPTIDALLSARPITHPSSAALSPHPRRQLLRLSLRSHHILGASICAFLCALT